MMPMMLVIGLCLISDPSDCTTVKVPLVVETLPTTCVLKAQETASHDHETIWADYRVTRLGCVRRGSKSAYAN
ncbi:hypothetical protein FV222_00385 [Methylobacterium sp. WL103]|uniref:hypothetical protein n=1 Tax=Methylobacterium sp. WL103 TaxID=2603891 RepID=UPI0011CB6E52|nr:hypothetical protein [Methylobacterium sp. WL103]TXN08962.1 hypothetical protein FV222_00385 [Methylobacterium sp. WL103]